MERQLRGHPFTFIKYGSCDSVQPRTSQSSLESFQLWVKSAQTRSQLCVYLCLPGTLVASESNWNCRSSDLLIKASPSCPCTLLLPRHFQQLRVSGWEPLAVEPSELETISLFSLWFCPLCSQAHEIYVAVLLFSEWWADRGQGTWTCVIEVPKMSENPEEG